jgi:hypothetical protein
VWVFAALLSGCLVSEEPLIRDSDSVTPLADGTYTFVLDGAEGQVVLSHSGRVTRMTTFDDGSSETVEMRMAKLEHGYYVVMSREDGDARYQYTLMRRERRRFTLYASDHPCRRLQELWLVGGQTPADVGIDGIDGMIFPSCKFTRYEHLANAFRDLLADGNLEPYVTLERQ